MRMHYLHWHSFMRIKKTAMPWINWLHSIREQMPRSCYPSMKYRHRLYPKHRDSIKGNYRFLYLQRIPVRFIIQQTVHSRTAAVHSIQKRLRLRVVLRRWKPLRSIQSVYIVRLRNLTILLTIRSRMRRSSVRHQALMNMEKKFPLMLQMARKFITQQTERHRQQIHRLIQSLFQCRKAILLYQPLQLMNMIW